MPSHPEFTLAFQAGIETKIAPPGTIGEAARFDVYRNNSLHSRIEALRARFPAVERLVGSEFFGMMAHEFLQAHPPRSPVLQEWGAQFAGFIGQFPPAATLPYLPDVARIEFARGQAYHAADQDPLPPDALQAHLDHLLDLRLDLIPAAQVLHLAQPGFTIWAQQQPDAAAREIRWAPECVFVSRAGMAVITCALSAAEAHFIEAVLAKQTCFEAIRHAQDSDPNFDPISALSRLIRDQQLTAAHAPRLEIR